MPRPSAVLIAEQRPVPERLSEVNRGPPQPPYSKQATAFQPPAPTGNAQHSRVAAQRPTRVIVKQASLTNMSAVDAYSEAVRLQKAGDIHGAVKSYRYSADKGHAKAQHNLASLHEYGLGVSKDDVEAVRLFRQAAAQGVAESQFSLGMHYKDGTGVEQDMAQSILYLTRAADQGHAKALFNLGLIYERGQAVESDPERARTCYTEAAALGNVKAAVNLGVLFSEGRVEEATPEKAVKWFQLAAEKGDSAAAFNLALAYGTGEGVQKDEAASQRLLETAASGSHPKAQYNLARRLLTGAGIEKDEYRARQLLQAAADAGERKAARALRAMRVKQPPPLALRLRDAASAFTAAREIMTDSARDDDDGSNTGTMTAEDSGQLIVRPSNDAVARVRAAAERRRRNSAGLPTEQQISTDVSAYGRPRRQSDSSLRPTATVTAEQKLHVRPVRRRSVWVDLREMDRREDDFDSDAYRSYASYA